MMPSAGREKKARGRMCKAASSTSRGNIIRRCHIARWASNGREQQDIHQVLQQLEHVLLL